MKSLSGRLSWGLALSLIILLIMQWAIASYAIRYLTENQVASRLIQDSENLLAGIRFDEAGIFHIDPKRVNVIYQRPFSGHYFVISVEGEKYVSRSLWDGDLAVPEVKPGVDVQFTIDGPEQESLLAVTHGYRKQDREISITVAENLDAFNAGLRQFQWIYGAVSTVVLAILLLVQNLIVRRELKPLKTLRANMASLERGETDRIETLGPAEIAPVITELNRLLATMGKKARRSRESLGNLAHALKTRLAVLNQLVEQPELKALPAIRQSIQDSTEAMRRIVERELKRARLIGDALPGQRVNLREEITLLVQTLQLMHSDKSPDIVWHVDKDAQFIGDQEDLLELLGNLLDNACKWSRNRVVLNVSSRDGVVFRIEDDGPGCGPEELEQLTRRGFRADESKPGSGLGLAIVRDIVESYGGNLTIARSSNLGGLSVEVWLPNR
ncbi:two-component system, OmpR family, sensor histidine kinase PhoQ [Methylophilaceae bacterium]|nr:two-component system, OmpR family, sensor histidine kinase PhoQ [Methylophilaceae bacterium]